MQKICLALLGLIISLYAYADEIKGYVFEREQGPDRTLPGVHVYFSGTNVGTVTDSAGVFNIDIPQGKQYLVFSFVGYSTDSIKVQAHREYKIVLERDAELNELVVYRKRSTTSIHRLNPIHTQIIEGAELHKAACCNLSESFETNPSVDVSYSDAVTGAKQIRLLGLAGKYSQLQTENFPSLKGLASNYSLTWIPGPWMESIQVSKGTASVLTGYESISGQINVEYKKPDGDQLSNINLFSTADGSFETNADYMYELNDKLSTGVFIHGMHFANKLDLNGDGFLSSPLIDRAQVFNRWKYNNPSNRFMMQAGINLLVEERVGGQKAYDRDISAAQQSAYGIELLNHHLEAFYKTGYTFKNEKTSIALISSYMKHKTRNQYGVKNYLGEESSVYVSTVLTQPLDFWEKHVLNVGAGYYYDEIEETFMGDYRKVESVPGLYTEYAFKPSHHFTLLTGLRADFHNLWGTLITPRMHVRYEPVHELTIRLSAGKGSRTANVLSDYSYALASYRTPKFTSSYAFEEAWNYGVTVVQEYLLNDRKLSIVLEASRTNFEDQLVADFQQSEENVMFYALDGRSFANSYQAEISYQLIENLDILTAYRYNDVQQTINGTLQEAPLMSKYKGLVTLNYATPLKKWMFDFTVQFNGGGRIPQTPGAPLEISPEERFDAYTVMNAQVTRYFKHWNIYVGAENLGNFIMDMPIVEAQNPNSKWFDATKTWGPVMGRRIYAGIRIPIDK